MAQCNAMQCNFQSFLDSVGSCRKPCLAIAGGRPPSFALASRMVTASPRILPILFHSFLPPSPPSDLEMVSKPKPRKRSTGPSRPPSATRSRPAAAAAARTTPTPTPPLSSTPPPPTPPLSAPPPAPPPSAAPPPLGARSPNLTIEEASCELERAQAKLRRLMAEDHDDTVRGLAPGRSRSRSRFPPPPPPPTVPPTLPAIKKERSWPSPAICMCRSWYEGEC